MEIKDEIKGRFRNDYHKTVINLIYTSNHISNKFNQFFKYHEITSQQYNIIRILRGFGPEPCSIDFIKERMLDKSSDVSRIVDRLLVKKLVVRTENKNDRRKKDIKITIKGNKLLLDMISCEKEVDTLLTMLTIDELNQLNQILDKIRLY